MEVIHGFGFSDGWNIFLLWVCHSGVFTEWQEKPLVLYKAWKKKKKRRFFRSRLLLHLDPVTQQIWWILKCQQQVEVLFGDFGSTYRWIPAQTLRILGGNLAILWGQPASFWEIAFGCDRTLNHKLWKYHATWTLIINLMLPDLPRDEVGSRGCTNSMVKRKWYVHRLDSSVREGTQVTWGSGPNSLFLIHDPHSLHLPSRGEFPPYGRLMRKRKVRSGLQTALQDMQAPPGSRQLYDHITAPSLDILEGQCWREILLGGRTPSRELGCPFI